MPKILVVEDDPLMALSLCDLLESEGYITLRAANGEDALEAIEQEAPDLLLTDYEMPHMNGDDLVNSVRGDDRFADLGIVMVSSRPIDRFRQRRIPVDAYVEKPYAARQLVDVVGRVAARPRRKRG